MESPPIYLEIECVSLIVLIKCDFERAGAFSAVLISMSSVFDFGIKNLKKVRRCS